MSLLPIIDLFPMSSCIATRCLVHNGGYIRKPLELLNWFETLWFGRLYLVTKVYKDSIEFTIFRLQYNASNFENPPLWTSL